MAEESSSRLKFLCSFGGNILPRPPDGHLKYVGGETRVVVAPRPLSFSDLRERIATVCDSDVIMKYQLNPEDLDALVTVRTDEDIGYMLEEYDRLEAASRSSSSSSSPASASSGPRFRIYLFPSNVPVAPGRRGLRRVNSMEQRYIDAVNGVSPPPSRGRRGGGGVGISSRDSSPGHDVAAEVESFGCVLSNRLWAIHKAHSSPNLQQLGESGLGGHRHFPLQHHCGAQHHWFGGGPPTRMGCSSHPTVHPGPRPSSTSRSHLGNGAGCHAEDFCCSRGSGEFCRGARHP